MDTTVDPAVPYEAPPKNNGTPPAAELMHIPEVQSAATIPGFATKDAWDLAQRQAKALMASDLVPQQYRNSAGNCIIALDMAYRMGASPLMVMQNLYIVNGRPGWSSQFLIATFNKSGRYTGIKYRFNADKTACRAWTTEKATGEQIEGTEITLDMANKEGWATKNGSKWKTMPELMLQYRAAAFLIRTYAPEISMGLQTAEEAEDIGKVRIEAVAWGALTPSQMGQATHEIQYQVTTADLVIAKFRLDPDGEQAAELRKVEPATAE